MTAASPTTDAVGLLLSGGLDSAILLGRFLAEGRRVQPFYVRSQLVWEEAEMDALTKLLAVMRSPGLDPLVVLELPLRDLYGDHWSTTGQNVPGWDTASDAVYLPGRNALLAIKPMFWCAMHGVEELALAILASNPFADATPDFFNNLERTVEQAIGRRIRVVRPFAHLEKNQVFALSRDVPLALTFSCIAPVRGLHCGRCNKCDERRKAFSSVGREDPTIYV